MANSKILTPEDKMKLRQPIDEYVGKIQKQIDVLRKDGTAKVLEYQNIIDGIKRDRTLTKGERENRISQCQVELEKAKAVESKNKDEISKLIADAENYLKAHFDKEYYTPIKESCAAEKVQAKERYKERLAELCDGVFPELATKSVDEKADYMIEQIADIVKVTNIPTDLNEFGVKMEDLDFLVQAGSDQKRLLVNNMKELSLDDIREIYLKVLK